MLNRRRLLALGGLTAGGAVLLPGNASQLFASAGTSESILFAGTGRGARQSVVPFAVQMPVPPVAQPVWSGSDVDLYRIAIKPATAEILPGVQTPIMSFDGGAFVGPTIHARTGRKTMVTYANQLDMAANVHLHGAHVAASSDGHPMDVIDPGGSRVYTYPNSQQGATLWYHDHSHHMEAEHVYRGLHGFYLIHDDAERDLGLPSGRYDVPILLRDAEFNADGTLFFPGNPANRTTILANGKPQPFFPVAARKYRFRLLNGATERIFNLSLGDGATMTQIGSDGGLLPAPVPRTEFSLGSAQRVEIVIDFAKFPMGSQVILSDTNTGPVLRFDVVRRAEDDSRVPDTLRALAPLPPATVTRDVALSFDLSGSVPVGLVNGKPFDPARSDFLVKRGTTEIWRVYNADVAINATHIFHLHLVQFGVLDRDGEPPTLDDAGRKDTVLVLPGKSVRVQATFGDFLGKYVYHCHFLEHSSLGMMANMEIVP
jgi:spore coat protein A